jgi:hypothetical protein
VYFLSDNEQDNFIECINFRFDGWKVKMVFGGVLDWEWLVSGLPNSAMCKKIDQQPSQNRLKIVYKISISRILYFRKKHSLPLNANIFDVNYTLCCINLYLNDLKSTKQKNLHLSSN